MKYYCYNFVLSMFWIVFNPVVLLHFVQLIALLLIFLFYVV